MAIEIVDFPMNRMVIFQCYVNVHQRVVVKENNGTTMFTMFTALNKIKGGWHLMALDGT